MSHAASVRPIRPPREANRAGDVLLLSGTARLLGTFGEGVLVRDPVLRTALAELVRSLDLSWARH